MRLDLLVFAMTAATSTPVSAADPALTIYRSDSDVLFEPGNEPIADGHAVVHEQRTLPLAGGRQTVVIDGLPSMLDTEAVAIDFGGAARVLGQRVVSAGEAGLLAAHRGEPVQVLATDGRPLAEGTLVAVDANGLGIRGANGRVAYVRDYARVEFAEGSGSPGSTLQVAVDGKAGAAPASLTYPTSGLGWRAAYSALLLGEDGCRLRLEALASIANRSGRDYAGARLKLVAGSPNFAKYDHGPRVMMMKAAAPAPAPESAPEQSALGDYRAYAIDGALDLPDASVTQVPLYASNELACERRWLYENGGTWFPPRPMLERDAWQAGGGPVQSQISFVAAENMPAGHLRVLVRDRDGRTELLGENRIADVGKGRDVQVDLGVAFDLGAKRERTTFKLDKAARELDEGLRITLDNRGERARTVTVREHPNRWRAWSLVSSSIKPAKQSPDLLEFLVAVPGGGTATLDYVVKYRWSPNED